MKDFIVEALYTLDGSFFGGSSLSSGSVVGVTSN